jgi:2-polyprenyl-3-methyl-5-hydroxy-6-metoxy-1,4-benzoquinol methylase
LSEAVRRQWNAAAGSFVEFVRSGKNYYAEYLNGPALKRMVGDAKGKRVLDIGCGEGFLSRYFAGTGAEVTAVDISEALIEAAKEEEQRHPLGVRYIAADASRVSRVTPVTDFAAFCQRSAAALGSFSKGTSAKYSSKARTAAVSLPREASS